LIFFSIQVKKGNTMKKAAKMIVATIAAFGFVSAVQADVAVVNGNLAAMSQCAACNAGFVGNLSGVAGTAGYWGATLVHINGTIDANASAWGVNVIGTSRAASMAETGYRTASVNSSAGSFSGVSVMGGAGSSASSAGSGGQAISWR
jgi:hypothetical protein